MERKWNRPENYHNFIKKSEGRKEVYECFSLDHHEVRTAINSTKDRITFQQRKLSGIYKKIS